MVVCCGVPAVPKAKISQKLGKIALEPIRKVNILNFLITSQLYPSYFKESIRILTLLYSSLPCIVWSMWRDEYTFPLWSSTTVDEEAPICWGYKRFQLFRKLWQNQSPPWRVKKLKNIGDAYTWTISSNKLTLDVKNSSLEFVKSKISDHIVAVFLVGLVWSSLPSCASNLNVQITKAKSERNHFICFLDRCNKIIILNKDKKASKFCCTVLSEEWT